MALAQCTVSVHQTFSRFRVIRIFQRLIHCFLLVGIPALQQVVGVYIAYLKQV